MTLFKYMRPERIDVVENLEIRFTQPDALNDPFELRPQFESLVAEADVPRARSARIENCWIRSWRNGSR